MRTVSPKLLTREPNGVKQISKLRKLRCNMMWTRIMSLLKARPKITRSQVRSPLRDPPLKQLVTQAKTLFLPSPEGREGADVIMRWTSQMFLPPTLLGDIKTTLRITWDHPISSCQWFQIPLSSQHIKRHWHHMVCRALKSFRRMETSTKTTDTHLPTFSR